MQSDKINEAIKNNDLRGLVSNLVSIDQYKSKMGEDKNMVVVAFKVKDKDPAYDLSQFIETGYTNKVLDVDVSSGPNKDGDYTVYVEAPRDSKLYDTVGSILNDITHVDEEVGSWVFTSYENKSPLEFTKENFSTWVLTSSYDYVVKHDPKAKEISERIKFLNNY